MGSFRYEEFENIAHVYIEDQISQVCDTTASYEGNIKIDPLEVHLLTCVG